MADENPSPDDPVDTDDAPEPLPPDRLTTPQGTGRARLALLVVAVLAVGFVLGGVLSGGDDGGGGDGGSGGADETSDEPLPFPTGDVNRVNYWRFGGLEPVIQDTFDRPDDDASRGETGTGPAWEAVYGTWAIRGDQAATSGGGAGEGPLLAVVPEGEGDGLTEVTMVRVEEGTGLVFRYLDAENYWSVTANPGVGSWSVNRVIEGDTELVSEVPAPTTDGITVSVTQDGSVVRVLFDGEEFLNVTDAALSEQLQGGLIAAANSGGTARWDRFMTMEFVDAASTTTTTAAP
jgi:hypothetical protein